MAEDSDSEKSRSEGRRKELRSKIQRSIELAEEEQKRELLKHRIDVARRGLNQFEAKQYPDAVRSFSAYIRILEDWKQVPAGSLSPACFDAQKEVPELLLVNSVFWHLVKLYDGTQGPEFSRHLEKFILFTKGMRFQPLAAETLRKYARARNVKHAKDLKNAYKMVANSKCFIATSLIDLGDERTLPALREFRDLRLRRTYWGRALIGSYYRWGPQAASILDRSPNRIRRGVSRCLDLLARVLS